MGFFLLLNICVAAQNKKHTEEKKKETIDTQ